jgi:hypothetical protein
MAALKLDFLVVPTYNTLTFAVADTSTYPDNPPVVTSPSLEINIPGFGVVYKNFNVENFTIINSFDLGLSSEEELITIPDGIYRLTYSIAPAYENYVSKSIMRTDKIQEKFDSAFMQLDLMECDLALKKQSSVYLNTVNFLIQGSIAAANNCSETQSYKLYHQANKMLDNFVKNNCGCYGNNYNLNFY